MNPLFLVMGFNDIDQAAIHFDRQVLLLKATLLFGAARKIRLLPVLMLGLSTITIL